MNTVLFDNVTKKDAKALAKWWTANTQDYYFARKMDNSKFWQVIRQSSKK